jgi:hypothetical protein
MCGHGTLSKLVTCGFAVEGIVAVPVCVFLLMHMWQEEEEARASVPFFLIPMVVSLTRTNILLIANVPCMEDELEVGFSSVCGVLLPSSGGAMAGWYGIGAILFSCQKGCMHHSGPGKMTGDRVQVLGFGILALVNGLLALSSLFLSKFRPRSAVVRDELPTLLREASRHWETSKAQFAQVRIDELTVELFDTDADTMAGEFCVICLSGYEAGESVRRLACHHAFHRECVDRWLPAAVQRRWACPMRCSATATRVEDREPPERARWVEARGNSEEDALQVAEEFDTATPDDSAAEAGDAGPGFDASDLGNSPVDELPTRYHEASV